MSSDTSTPAAALFDEAGPSRWVPTEYARGPWDPRACHGGPVSALLTRAVEQADPESQIEWHLARLSVELTRPVPVGRPLELSTEIERAGRKVSLVAARLLDDGTEVARIRALRIRTIDVPLPRDAVEPTDPPPGSPTTGVLQRSTWASDDAVAFHTSACEHRFTEGSWEQPGPVAVWIRLTVGVVHGETPSGAQRAAAAADFGNGVSAGLPSTDHTFINPDLTVHLLRPVIGEWVGMRSASFYGTPSSCGTGFAESALYDVEGRIGRSVQSLLIDTR